MRKNHICMEGQILMFSLTILIFKIRSELKYLKTLRTDSI